MSERVKMILSAIMTLIIIVLLIVVPHVLALMGIGLLGLGLILLVWWFIYLLLGSIFG
jgi:hypothetical protein